jgi:type IV pilus assembly protein PilQ
MFNTDVGTLLKWTRRINVISLFAISIVISGLVYSDPVSTPAQDKPILAAPDDVINIPLPSPPPSAKAATPVLVAPNAVEAGSTTPSVQANTPTEIRPVNGMISFYFQNIAIKSLLQLIAKNSGLNFIISENVKGDTTLNLKNVTWHQALDIILQSNGLASRQIGTAVFISTMEDIAQKQAKEYQAEENASNMAPLSTAYITLKYSDAAVIAKVLKSSDGSLLTARGDVTVNSPTNSIIVRDIKRNLADIRNFIYRMDIPARQVSIEARIVNIDTTYEAQMGVRFGVSNTRSLSGTLAGASQLANGVSVSNIVPIDQRLNFDLPASLLSTGTTPGSIGLALARLGPVLLDLELSALEEEGHTQIISKPRVVTANQQKAMIQTGEEIPYQQATSSGATSVEFKKAVLSLEIIPQITPDDKIILKLKATQDTRGTQLLVAQGGTQVSSATSTGGVTTSTPAVFGPPTINTQEVQSYVVLNDNETVVIGGVYKLTKANTLDRVPFFGSLPIVGGLFRHRGIKNVKSELLIYLTPKIIRQHARVASYKGD